MCAPQVLMAGAGIAQAAVGFAAASQDFNARSAQWRQNYVNSLAAGRDEQRQLTLRQLQEQDAAIQKGHLLMLDEAERRSEVAVDAATAGIGGVTLDNLLTDVSRKAALNRATLATNYKNTAQQLQTEKDASVTGIENRINSVARPTSPSPASFLVEALGSGVRAFS